MLRYEPKPGSTILPTTSTSTSAGCGSVKAGSDFELGGNHSRPWNESTRTTQQPGRAIGLLKGLSRMRGNSHVRFLEGLGARKSPWPTRRLASECTRYSSDGQDLSLAFRV